MNCFHPDGVTVNTQAIYRRTSMKKSAPFLLLTVLFVAAAWYFFTTESEKVDELPPPPLLPDVPAAEPQPEPVEDITGYPELEPVIVPEPLPPLNESDREVIQALAETMGADPLAEYLVKGQVISRVVATVDSLTSRQVPAQINPIKPADDKFIAAAEGDSLIMSAQNFARYQGYVAMIQYVDSDVLTAFYQRYYPLFQQAWEENGGEGSFNGRLIEVIDQLLETPDVPDPVYLTKPEAVYLFEDPALEALSAGQKILVRMGSVNASVVKEKLAELKAEIKP